MNGSNKAQAIHVPFYWLGAHFAGGVVLTLFAIALTGSMNDAENLLASLGNHLSDLWRGVAIGTVVWFLVFVVSRSWVERHYQKATAFQRDFILFLGVASLVLGNICSSVYYCA